MNNKIIFMMCFAFMAMMGSGHALFDTNGIQGRLYDSSGNALVGTYAFSFNIYNTTTAGTSLYEINQTLVTDSHGIYSTIIKNVDLPFDVDYYLGVNVNSTGEMPLRLNITAVGTAINSNNTENLGGVASDVYLNDTDFGSAGLMKTDGSGVYSIITDSSSNWDDAWGWGDHALEDYFTHVDNFSANFTNISVSDQYQINGVQLDSDDIPDHNGHSVCDTFAHIINRGKAEAINVSKTAGLGINWTTGELYSSASETFFVTTAGSGNLNDNIVNYLKWVSGTGLTITTSTSSDDEILIATFSVYDGVINGFREHSIISESVADTRRGLRIAFPNRIISGMSVSEDADVTNALDVTMDSGVLVKDGIEEKNPITIN